MAINTIQSSGTWGQAASDINNNFTSMSTEIVKIRNTTSVKLPWATTVAELKQFVPNPYEGQFGLVGSTLPATIYKWNGTNWISTGQTGGDGDINVAQYLTYEVTGTI